MTFSQAAIAYRKAEKSTRFLDRIEDHWKDTLIRKIEPGAVRQSAITLYPDAKGATRNRQVIVPTQAIINYAATLGWCLPIKVKRFDVERKVKTPATLEWVRAFAANSSPRLGALCMFMFGTGARIGEAVTVTWGDVDLLGRTATFNQSKIGEERKAHLPTEVVAALANIPSNRSPNDLVFGYVARDRTTTSWRNAVKRAGIAYLSPHSCRHAFATMMLRNGYDVKTVAKLGGWKDAATVLKYYAHALDDPTLTDALFGTNLTQGQYRERATALKQRTKNK